MTLLLMIWHSLPLFIFVYLYQYLSRCHHPAIIFNQSLESCAFYDCIKPSKSSPHSPLNPSRESHLPDPFKYTSHLLYLPAWLEITCLCDAFIFLLSTLYAGIRARPIIKLVEFQGFLEIEISYNPPIPHDNWFCMQWRHTVTFESGGGEGGGSEAITNCSFN